MLMPPCAHPSRAQVGVSLGRRSPHRRARDAWRLGVQAAALDLDEMNMATMIGAPNAPSYNPSSLPAQPVRREESFKSGVCLFHAKRLPAQPATLTIVLPSITSYNTSPSRLAPCNVGRDVRCNNEEIPSHSAFTSSLFFHLSFSTLSPVPLRSNLTA